MNTGVVQAPTPNAIEGPTDRRLTGFAWFLTALSFGAVVLDFVLVRWNHSTLDRFISNNLFGVVLGLSFPLIGTLIASRQQRNPIGWILIGVGLAAVTTDASIAYARHALLVAPGSLPGGDIASWVGAWMWVPNVGALPLVLLLFPTGRPPSGRWWKVVWATVAEIAFLLVGTMSVWPLRGIRLLHSGTFSGNLPLLAKISLSSTPLLLIAIVLGMIALGSRFRRSQGDERQQLKWFTFAAALVVLEILAGFVAERTGWWHQSPVWDGLTVIPLALAIAIAILKYRLYDIDLVINKTVVFGALAAFITLVYVAIVVGIGNAVGSGGKPNLGLSILATAIVAVGFQPVRDRVQRLANVLVYGHRASPYEVLAEFSDRVAQTYSTEDVLPRMARTVAEGTGAQVAQVWLKAGEELRRAAAWPLDDHSSADAVPLSDGQLPSISGVDRSIEVRHQGELLGALSVSKSKADPLTPAEDKLLRDLASQAGLVLRNVGLTAELLARLDELTASRQRLVAAQDQERRRLERNLHDGAQQHLVALKMRLNLANTLAERDPSKAREILAELPGEADEALETLRDLARGIYPPLLAAEGLSAALQAQAGKAPLPVEIEGDIGRFPQEVEAAVYFCCLEALQNIAKYAHASLGKVTLLATPGSLAFSVQDDGRGFDPTTTPKGSGLQNMVDRLEALGGSIEVRSSPSGGTTITGQIPAHLERA